MLQTSALLIVWLAACALLPARLAGWVAPARDDARAAARLLAVHAPLLAGSAADDAASERGFGATPRSEILPSQVAGADPTNLVVHFLPQ